MRVLVPGQIYRLANTGQTQRTEQPLTFALRGEQDELLGDGTTTADVLNVLIDRVAHLEEHHPSKAYGMALTYLQEAHFWLDHYRDDAERELR